MAEQAACYVCDARRLLPRGLGVRRCVDCRRRVCLKHSATRDGAIVCNDCQWLRHRREVYGIGLCEEDALGCYVCANLKGHRVRTPFYALCQCHDCGRPVCRHHTWHDRGICHDCAENRTATGREMVPARVQI